MINGTNAIYEENETQLSWPIDRVWFMMKTRQENNVLDCISLAYAKTETKLPKPINSTTVCDENQTRQWCDQSYKCNLHWKQ